jgi:hypothetical protein
MGRNLAVLAQGIRMTDRFKIKWIDGKKEPQVPADANYPRGITLDLRATRKPPFCETDLPYPARRIGFYAIECTKCGLSVMVTTAGRADDPCAVIVTCKTREELQ